MTELDEEAIKIYGEPLTGKYKHFCMEFDGLPIDEHSSEFAYCSCFEEDEAKVLSDRQVIKNELRQAWYDENNKDTSNLSPRDVGFHVGLKAGLLKAINILDKHEENNPPNPNPSDNPYIGL